MQAFYLILLVSLGSVLGAYLRFQFLDYWLKRFSGNFLGICILNIFSAFLLGILSALYINKELSSPIFLFSSTGFIASLSTFSSLAISLLEYLYSRMWKEFFLVSIFSLFGGPIVIFLAYKLLNA